MKTMTCKALGGPCEFSHKGGTADELIKAMADASEEHLAMWSKDVIIRELVGSAAIAVQRGTALAYLDS